MQLKHVDDSFLEPIMVDTIWDDPPKYGDKDT